LCNRERASPQSFPGDFEFVGSVPAIRRQVGNAVPPDGVKLVAERLMPLFTGNYVRVGLRKIRDKLQTLSIKERLLYDLPHSKINMSEGG
jgi:DNA (cytosine-5)-methyltransferase 1